MVRVMRRYIDPHWESIEKGNVLFVDCEGQMCSLNGPSLEHNYIAPGIMLVNMCKPCCFRTIDWANKAPIIDFVTWWLIVTA
jgi:hypothetical protein